MTASPVRAVRSVIQMMEAVALLIVLQIHATMTTDAEAAAGLVPIAKSVIGAITLAARLIVPASHAETTTDAEEHVKLFVLRDRSAHGVDAVLRIVPENNVAGMDATQTAGLVLKVKNAIGIPIHVVLQIVRQIPAALMTGAEDIAGTVPAVNIVILTLIVVVIRPAHRILAVLTMDVAGSVGLAG